MISFHNQSTIKAKYLNRVISHQKADNLIRGKGWENGKGCAVGCTLEQYNHKAYETELGIPEWLARVEDTLFEGMAEDKSRTWPEKFLESIPLGVDLEQVRKPFLCIVLRHTLVSMDKVKYDEQKWPGIMAAIIKCQEAVKQTISALESDSAVDSAADSAVDSAVDSAAYSAAYSAADSAAYSAAYSAADSAAYSAYSAYSAARSAADSAAYSAYSAYSAARSAARSAADSAAYSAYSAAYDYYADELLKLLRNAK